MLLVILCGQEEAQHRKRPAAAAAATTVDLCFFLLQRALHAVNNKRSLTKKHANRFTRFWNHQTVFTQGFDGILGIACATIIECHSRLKVKS